MATQTVRLVAFDDETTVISMEYNDVSMNITAIVGDLRNAVVATDVTIWRTSDGVQHGARFPAGQLTRIVVPTGAAQRVRLGRDGNHLTGYDYAIDQRATT